MKKVFYDNCLSMLNVPYIWGGNSPLDGLDCSGFALECLRAVIPARLDMTSQQMHDFYIKEGNRTEPKFGALLFFGRSTLSITHVAIVIDDGNLMIEAGGGGRKNMTFDDACEFNARVRIRPIQTRSDRVGCLMPKYPWAHE